MKKPKKKKKSERDPIYRRSKQSVLVDKYNTIIKRYI